MIKHCASHLVACCFPKRKEARFGPRPMLNWRCGQVRTMSNRRKFLIAGALIALSFHANAQDRGKMPRVGVLGWDAISSAGLLEPFRVALQENGYVEGKNVQIEWRFADGRTERAREIAEGFVLAGVDVIVAFSTPAAHAAKGGVEP